MTDILEPQLIPIDELKSHPKNYRSHPNDQLEHIESSIQASGFYRNVVTANDGTILAGHGVVLAAKNLGIPKVPCVMLPVDPESNAALKVLTGDNYISHLAENDDRALIEILQNLHDEEKSDSLHGTGFDDRMLAAMATLIAPPDTSEPDNPNDHWVGMPEFEPGDLETRLNVKFLNESDRSQFISLLAEHLDIDQDEHISGTGTTFGMWWPPRQTQDLSSLEMAVDGDGDSSEE